jgi:hypothetical protein
MANKGKTDVQRTDMQAAFELLSEHVDLREVDQFASLRSNAVYTNGLAIWLMVLQRMTPEGTLESSVKQLLDSGSHLLPKNKRVLEKTLSPNTGAFSKARKRVPLESVKWLCDQAATSIVSRSPTAEGDTPRFYLIDGTTLALQPTGELRKAYPPASNQYGTGVWPIVNMAVAHELESGCALRPEIGPMYGEDAVSETTLACQCVERLPAGSAVMADSGFGIFFFAFHCQQHGHPFLFRLTDSRWRAMVKHADLESAGSNWATYKLTWSPSVKDRASHPELPADAKLEVRLHECHVHANLTLRQVTDLPGTALDFTQKYLHRSGVEIDIRNLKVVLDTEHIRAKSPEMFLKELLTSIVAYNLVGQFRRQAAVAASVAPRQLSFKRVWTTFTIFLLRKPATGDFSEWEARYNQALRIAQKDKLPNRPGRQFTRAAYPRRPKTTHFEKRKPPSNTAQNLEPM